MSRRRPLWPALLVPLLLLVPLACSGGPPQAERHALVIGVDLPLAGPDTEVATAALEELRGVLSASFGGSVEGMPVSLRVFDDTSGGRRDPVQGERNLRQLAADPSVLGVIGPLDSDVAEAEIPVAAAAHLPLVAPGATSACLNRPLPACDGLGRRLRGGAPAAFFRVAPADDLEGPALLRFARSNLHATHFAVASDGRAYGSAARDRFVAALHAEGLAPVFGSDFDPRSAAAAAAFASGAKAAGADAVFLAGRGDGGACQVTAAVVATLGSPVPVLGGSGLLGSACETDAGVAAGDVYAPGEAMSVPAGAALKALLEAIATAIKGEGGNVPTREEVRLALSRQKSFDPWGDLRTAELSIYRGQAPAPGTPAPTWVRVGSVLAGRAGN